MAQNGAGTSEPKTGAHLGGRSAGQRRGTAAIAGPRGVGGRRGHGDGRHHRPRPTYGPTSVAFFFVANFLPPHAIVLLSYSRPERPGLFFLKPKNLWTWTRFAAALGLRNSVTHGGWTTPIVS